MSDFYSLTLLLFVAAILYTSVGHAGASGYLAAMAFYGLAPEAMRPTALVLNLVAATLATARFRSAGYFDRRLFLPLVAGSIPGAFVGGFLDAARAGVQADPRRRAAHCRRPARLAAGLGDRPAPADAGLGRGDGRTGDRPSRPD